MIKLGHQRNIGESVPRPKIHFVQQTIALSNGDEFLSHQDLAGTAIAAGFPGRPLYQEARFCPNRKLVQNHASTKAFHSSSGIPERLRNSKHVVIAFDAVRCPNRGGGWG